MKAAMADSNKRPPTLSEQVELLRRREVSPVELTRAYLQRIERLQPKLNAYISVTAEAALEAARRAESEIAAGNCRGPLHGIPISFKDLIATAGIRTTAGSKILADHIPGEDATVAQKLAAAGAICLGKNNLHEFAFGVTSNNEHYGPVRNPWNTDLIPGGSSGGSAAAVAAGLCTASVGTDTGGSIRIPASACGCVGLKPTYGLVSRYGVVPLSWSMDHVGPISQTVTDAAFLLNALAGYDPCDPSGSRHPAEDYVRSLCSEPTAVRLGVCPPFFFDNLHPEVLDAVRGAIRTLETRWGAVREVVWPSLEHSSLVGTVVAFVEASSYHEDWIRSRPGDYEREVLQRLRMGMMFLATDYLRCQRIRQKILEEASEVFRQIDVLVYPTLPFTGAKIGAESVRTGKGEEDVRSASIRFNRPANLTGYPALSLPCGFSSEGLPIGLQLMAAPFQEALLLQVAHFYESQTDWRHRHPAM